MRHTVHHLAGDLDAPTRSRRLTEDWAVGHPRRYEIVLAVSEIVANAVTHGAPLTTENGVMLRFDDWESCLRVAVAHPGAVFDPHNDRDFGGLAIVERAVDRWGVEERDGNVEVWFEVDHADSNRSYGDASDFPHR
jgi:anti-sigma regulatory factor (Ser/Thr protein kinase)